MCVLCETIRLTSYQIFVWPYYFCFFGNVGLFLFSCIVMQWFKWNEETVLSSSTAQMILLAGAFFFILLWRYVFVTLRYMMQWLRTVFTVFGFPSVYLCPPACLLLWRRPINQQRPAWICVSYDATRSATTWLLTTNTYAWTNANARTRDTLTMYSRAFSFRPAAAVRRYISPTL